MGLDISEGNPLPHPHSHFDLKYSWVFSLYALSKGMVHSTQHSWYLVRTHEHYYKNVHF